MAKNDPAFLEELYTVIRSRKSDNPETSYTAKLFAKGRLKIAQKVGEEAVETVIEATADARKKTISESADLVFHLLVLWAEMDIEPKEVIKELRKRHEEKRKAAEEAEHHSSGKEAAVPPKGKSAEGEKTKSAKSSKRKAAPATEESLTAPTGNRPDED